MINTKSSDNSLKKVGSRGISVIICCYNSDWVLPKTLDSLARQLGTRSISWEICIVDNNSQDCTSECALTFAQSHESLDVRLLSEPEQGLSHARMRGFQAAKYSTLIFCDDDTLLNPDYVMTASAFMQTHPEVGLCGGLGCPVFEAEPDRRILPYLDRYATGPQGPGADCDITERGFVFGAGMVVRRTALDAILSYGFNFFSLGRRGKMLTGGEDVELGHAIRAAGYRIHYFAALQYQHILPAHRTTWSYLNAMAVGNGYSSIIMPWPNTLFSCKSHPLYVAGSAFWRLFKSWLQISLLSPSPSQTLSYSAALGSVKGVLSEFPGLFAKRRDAQKLFRKIMQHKTHGAHVIVK